MNYPSVLLSFANKVLVVKIRSKIRINYMTQVVAITNLPLTSDFKVTMINYKHIPSILHSARFPACSISKAEVQSRTQRQQLGRCQEVFLNSCAGSHIPPHIEVSQAVF